MRVHESIKCCPQCGAPAPNGREVSGFIVELIIPLQKAKDVVEPWLQIGHKISAIKALREAYPGLGLKDAKEIVEYFQYPSVNIPIHGLP